jgi:hypothetical protein
MRTLLFTSFLITGLAGSAFAKTADISHTGPVNKNCTKLVADMPTPNPTSKRCPLRADMPTPNPTSKRCPLRAA